MENDLAGHLKAFREASGLTQEELSEKADVSVRTISDIERGLRSTIYKGTAERLAIALALSPATRSAFLEIARGRRPGSDEPRLAAGVPMPASSLLGRDSEIARIVEMFSDPGIRMVTLVGSGGVGKTRLALECAQLLRQEFPDGVFFISLSATFDSALIIPTIARSLGVVALEQSAFEATTQALRSMRALLILDTFEHVVSAAPDIADLVAACPSVSVLITSREALRVRAELQMPVLPLRPDDAVALFRQRASGAAQDMNALAEEVCRRLEGIPLAIELAAARAKHLPLPALIARLDEGIDVLARGPRDLPERQRTLRDTIAWSYDLLGEDEKSMLRTLSTFAGGSSIDAVANVAGMNDPLPVLSALVDKSLVISDLHSDEPRYRMLDMVLQFATEQRERLGELARTNLAHAIYFASVAERAEPELTGGEHKAWMLRLDLERDNFRAALRRSIDARNGELSLRIAGCVWQYWRARGDLEEGRAWLNEALALNPDSDSSERAKALWGAAWLAYHAADYQAAEVRSVELLALTRRTRRDPTEVRNALTVRSMIAMAQERYAEASVGFKESVELCRPGGSRWLLATSLLNYATALMHSGEPMLAQENLQEAREMYRQVGDRHFTARSQVYIGLAQTIAGEHEAARESILESLLMFVTLEDAAGLAEAFEALAAVDSIVNPLLAAYETGVAERIRSEIALRPFPFDARFAAARRAQIASHPGWSESLREGRDADLQTAVARCL